MFKFIFRVFLQPLCRLGLLVGLGIAAPSVLAQELETLSLRYRTAEQVLPALRPLDNPPRRLGHAGTIMIGRSAPVVAQTVSRSVFGAQVAESVTYRDVATGFTVVPRLAGDRVTLEPAAQAERSGGRMLSSNQASVRDDRRVWVRVQEVQ